jgi:ribosomal protein L7/L12
MYDIADSVVAPNILLRKVPATVTMARVYGREIELSAQLVTLIQQGYKHAKVQIIKFVRAEFNLGLKETKDLCDAIYNDPANIWRVA